MRIGHGLADLMKGINEAMEGPPVRGGLKSAMDFGRMNGLDDIGQRGALSRLSW